MKTDKYNKYNHKALEKFCREVFISLGINTADAQEIAGHLIIADLRGVHSHGVARMRRYADGLKNGTINANADEKIIRDTQISAVIDAGGGMGHPVSKRAMELAIKKADNSGAGFVAVKNSNHYGIAGYYSMMALDAGFIGFSATNSEAIVIPTFGRQAMLGTNPISFAAPAKDEEPFVLDMATSVVPRGKLETFARLKKDLPPGWAADEYGISHHDPVNILKNITSKIGGGIFPLGSEGELYSGYKGYGLAAAVEILTSMLSGALPSFKAYPHTPEGKPLNSGIGHFFAAMRIDLFRDPDEFKQEMDEMIRALKNSPKAKGQERIFIHGEKELGNVKKQKEEGLFVHGSVIEELEEIAEETGIDFAPACILENTHGK